MSSVTQRLLTAEEFWLLPETEMHRALVRGEVVETMPPGGKHGGVASATDFQLRLWARSGPGGYVGVESGFILARDPDTVRGPDVYYVRAERIPSTGIPDAFWDILPDLAVEVVSPDDSATEVREKVREYLDAGVPMVWVMYPRSREVIVHTSDGLARAYGPDDVLEGLDLLPGFRCRVAELFE